jgi:hypothetical protein
MMNVERSVDWELTGETEVVGGNLPQCHFVHHKSHMIWPVLEPDSSGGNSRHGSAPSLLCSSVRERHLKERIVPTIKVEEYTKQEGTRCKRLFLWNTRALPELQGVTTQKFALFIITAVMTWNPTCFRFLSVNVHQYFTINSCNSENYILSYLSYTT